MHQTRPLFASSTSKHQGFPGRLWNGGRQRSRTRCMQVMLVAAGLFSLMFPLLMSGMLQQQAQKYLLPGMKERPRDKYGYALPTDAEVDRDMTVVLTHGDLGSYTKLHSVCKRLKQQTRAVRVLLCSHRALVPKHEWKELEHLMKGRRGKFGIADVPIPFLDKNAARSYCARWVGTRYAVFITSEVDVRSPRWLHMLHARLTASGAPAISVALGPPAGKSTEEPSLGMAVKGGDKGFVQVSQALEGDLLSSGQVVAVRFDVLRQSAALQVPLFKQDVPSRWKTLDLYLSIVNLTGSEPYGVSGEDAVTMGEQTPLLVRDMAFIAMRSIAETHDDVANRLRDTWQLPFSVDCWERLRVDKVLRDLSFTNGSFSLDPFTHSGMILSLLVLAGNNRFRVSSMHSEGPGSEEVEHVFHGNATSTIKYVYGLYMQQHPQQQQQQQQPQGRRRRQQPQQQQQLAQSGSQSSLLSLSILNPHQVRKRSPQRGTPRMLQGLDESLHRETLGGAKAEEVEGGGGNNGTSESWAKARKFAEGLIAKGQALSRERCAPHGGTYPDFSFIRCLMPVAGRASLRQRLDAAASMVILRPIAGQLDYWLWLRDGSTGGVLRALEQGRARWIALGQRADLNCYQPHEHDAVDLPVSFDGPNANRASRLVSWAYRPLTGEEFEELWDSIARDKI